MSTRVNVEKFWSHVDIRDPDECWEWQGFRMPFGHGNLCVGGRQGRNYGAHQVSWFLYDGAYPADLCVLHKCDNPACVNPEHLFLGTRIDNNLDRDRKGRTKKDGAPPGEANVMSKLRREDVWEIRRLYTTGRIPYSMLGKMWRICPAHAGDIVRRNRWRHI